MNKKDWEIFKKKLIDSKTEVNVKEYNDAVVELVNSGVLSLKPKGNYQIFNAYSIPMRAPDYAWSVPLYFTKKSDAVKYAGFSREDCGSFRTLGVMLCRIVKEF